MSRLFIPFLFFFVPIVKANDSALVSKLLTRIEAMQVKENGVFPLGSIPSYRLYALNQDRYRADVNPFFTGLISFSLQSVLNELSEPQRTIANRIIQRGTLTYSKFKNKKSERDTYNFWPTDTAVIFPNAGWMNLFDKSQSLPDDFDDTVILLMAQQKSDSIAKLVHALMQLFTNNNGLKKVKNTFPEYDTLNAYSTWFGKKMPIDFDICVLTNVLYFVQSYNLKWTKADSASLQLITHAIQERRHITAANYISPHYATTSIILYHIARLMSAKRIPELERLKSRLIEDLQQLLPKAKTFMDKVILSTSLLRLGVEPPLLNINAGASVTDLIEDERFSFFIANMASMLSNPFKQIIGNLGAGKFYYYCPAYNNTLMLEYLLLYKRRRGY